MKRLAKWFMHTKWFEETKLGQLFSILMAPILLFMVVIPLYMVLGGAATAIILAPIKFVVWVFSNISF
jgi:hypothetical protein